MYTAVSVVVKLGGGQSLELVDVGGDQPLSTLDTLIRERLAASGDHSGLKYSGIQSVNFSDSAESAVEKLNAELKECAEPSTAVIAGGLCEGEEQLHVTGISQWHSSLWAGQPISDLKSARTAFVAVNQPGQPVSREVLTLRLTNFARDTFDGIQTYKQHGNDRLYIKVIVLRGLRNCCLTCLLAERPQQQQQQESHQKFLKDGGRQPHLL